MRSLALKSWFAVGILIVLAALVGGFIVDATEDKVVMASSGLLVAFVLFVLWDDTR